MDEGEAGHGYNRYANGCRCQVCRMAKRQYMRDKRGRAAERRRRSDNPSKYVALGITHGTYAGYTDAQCRCNLCAAVKADHDRKDRQQRAVVRSLPTALNRAEPDRHLEVEDSATSEG